MLDNREVRPGKFIGVCVSLDNCRLFIGSIPKDKKKEEILEEMKKVGERSRPVVHNQRWSFSALVRLRLGLKELL